MRNITTNFHRNNITLTTLDKENINQANNKCNTTTYNQKQVTKHSLTISSPEGHSNKKARLLLGSISSNTTCNQRNMGGVGMEGGYTYTKQPSFRSINTVIPPSSQTMKTSNCTSSSIACSTDDKMDNDNQSRRNQTIGSAEVDREDFSFARLKGAVQKFEQDQKEHHKSHQYNTSVSSLGLTSATSFGTMDSGSSTTSSALSSVAVDEFVDEPSTSRYFNNNSSRFSTPPRKRFVDDKNDNTSNRQTTASTTSASTVNGDEDFSFQKLKQKALGMEKAAGSNTIPNGLFVLGKSSLHKKSSRNSNDEEKEKEDFSFHKLKEKALMGPSTPLRKVNPNKNNNHRTPIRTTPVRKVNNNINMDRSCNRTTDNSNHMVAPHTLCGKTRRPLVPPTSYVHVSTNQRSNSTPKKRMPMLDSMEGTCGGKFTVPSTETKRSTFNPNRFQFKPKIKREEVQATNDTIASVQKLSQWLSDDPFEKKKQLLIRKGEQIANKSRAFEHEELVNVQGGYGNKLIRESRAQREKQYFPEGKVSQNKDWLQNAFGERSTGSGGNGRDNPENLGVLEKKKIIESAFKKKHMH